MSDRINAKVLEIAESWMGTPYRHQGSTKGVGCDCLGLIRGIWRELYGCEPEQPPPYARDWAERGGEDRLLQAALRHFGPPVGMADGLPGDLVLFRWRQDHAAKHAGILAGDGSFIHAYEQAAVVKSVLVPSWRRRTAGIFRFPPKA